MLRKLGWVFGLAVCLGGMQISLAATYFVAAEGSDQANGSQAQPFKTLRRAVGDLKPGDTVVVQEGTYQEPLTLAGLKGNADQPITIQAARGKRVVLDLVGRQKALYLSRCAYVVIRHLEIAGADAGAGIGLRNCEHCRVEGNVIHDCVGVGIRLWASHENEVRGNISYRNRGGAYVGEGSTHNRIEGNSFVFNNLSSENSDGIGSSDCTENVYRFNLMVGNSDDGLDMWTSTRSTIEYNFACSNGDGPEGDGNGFKLGGRWKDGSRKQWTGGLHTVRNNLSCWNRSTGFTDNTSTGNNYEGNVSYGNLNTSSYASIPHTDPAAAEPIRAKIRAYLAGLIEEGILQPEVHPLPYTAGVIRALKVWPE